MQTAYLLYRREYASPWWRVALAYALLMLTVHKVVWDGYPGAVTRVTLPLVFGFNVLLAREDGPRFWPWFVLGNLHLLAARDAAAVSRRVRKGCASIKKFRSSREGLTLLAQR